ncbi:MAG: hypothetical protein LBH13_05305 [Cellulomonadaceae bacterium]|jgi:hypothetical protein|nr:hypothetical protein [Cellulomonadaceae bacterium]
MRVTTCRGFLTVSEAVNGTPADTAAGDGVITAPDESVGQPAPPALPGGSNANSALVGVPPATVPVVLNALWLGPALIALGSLVAAALVGRSDAVGPAIMAALVGSVAVAYPLLLVGVGAAFAARWSARRGGGRLKRAAT